MGKYFLEKNAKNLDKSTQIVTLGRFEQKKNEFIPIFFHVNFFDKSPSRDDETFDDVITLSTRKRTDT